MPPHHKNFNKRIVKTPKLYFCDTGLACSLLGINHQSEIENSHFRGALFENLVILEWIKKIKNRASNFQTYFWRDSKGVEIDLLLDTGKKLVPVEIKAGQTFQNQFLKNMNLWNTYAQNSGGLLQYNGDLQFTDKSRAGIFNWRNQEPYKIIK